MTIHKPALLFFGLAMSAILSASPVSFTVNVNTSSLSGSAGNVDFQYNPGIGVSDPSLVTIDLFVPGGQLNGVRQICGAVTGLLPGPVRINNAPNFNDYFEGLTFTNALSFRVTFDGPVPSGRATAPSTFAFTLFAADEVTPLLGSGPNGEYVTGTVSPAGVVSFSTPEPGSFALLGLGMGALAFTIRKRRAECEHS